MDPTQVIPDPQTVQDYARAWETFPWGTILTIFLIFIVFSVSGNIYLFIALMKEMRRGQTREREVAEEMVQLASEQRKTIDGITCALEVFHRGEDRRHRD